MVFHVFPVLFPYLSQKFKVRPQDILLPDSGRFIFGRTLGKGQKGQVVEVTDSQGSALVAKIGQTQKACNELYHEAMVLRMLQHLDVFPHFVGLFAASDPHTNFLVLERFHGSLEDFCRKDYELMESDIRSIGIQVLTQLQLMHEMNLAHGDLKAKNMAVASIKPLKILD